MQDLIIPGWALWIIVTFGGGWLYWMVLLTKMATKALKDNELSTHKDAEILKDIVTLDEKVNDIKKDFHDALKGINDKLSSLISDFQFMKGLIASQSGKKSG